MLETGDIAFKKVDSLMRGNTLSELHAVTGFDHCVLAPAFPGQGRITRGGRQHVWTDGEWRPVGPDLAQSLGARRSVL